MVISVGRIDAVISDDIEARFRIEIVKRFGGKKGDLQRAVEEAIELWIKNPVVRELEKVAKSEV